MWEKILNYIGKAMNANDRSVLLHDLVFVVFAVFVIIALNGWFVYNWIKHLDMGPWSTTLVDCFLTASGVKVFSRIFGGNQTTVTAPDSAASAPLTS